MIGTEREAARQDPAAEDRFVRVDVGGAVMQCRTCGSGPLLVLLHGMGRTGADWAEQHDRLTAGHRVVSMDLPGFGGSDRLPPPTTLTALAGAVWRTLDALAQDGPAVLVGNSLGGAVAMQASLDRPDRCRGLVLLSSAGFGRRTTAGLRLAAVPGLGRALLAPHPSVAARVERAQFHDPALATPARVRTALTAAEAPWAASVFGEVLHDLGDWRGVRGPWRRALLTKVAAAALPTLLVWGARDRILPAAHLAAAAAALPHATTRLLPDCGHMPQIERPDEVAALVADFVAELP
ncbi:alpha/beta fold hydrolase [Nakamurella flavida]|uniref:Alpha/beta fold hydrolase n=1 Tax=Nakamurella flavida TaxID=363630 RepID=A0A938YMT3_9ACTN|nr:alpha/beta fold hydrolase [Nakamurella flavida]MBM9478149.1 alpha/beta fold hydrolase [Nakamurella flavida]MDP9778629.1 pimeloyl-ACP methyl ester carboxylesterase [Nakamurella flavida]